MALLDFLKRKKKVEESRKSFDKIQDKSEKKPAKSSAVKKPEVKEVKKIETIESAPAKNIQAKANNAKFYYEAVKQPHISEKASYLSEKDQYIFEIAPDFNKKEIKNTVEGIYGVDVLSVNIIKIPSKKRRLGRTEGFRKGYKKAIVKIREGQKIEIL